MSVSKALRSWRHAKAQPTAAVRRAQLRSGVKLVLTTGACIAAMLLIVVPLLTLEADANRGFAAKRTHGDTRWSSHQGDAVLHRFLPLDRQRQLFTRAHLGVTQGAPFGASAAALGCDQVVDSFNPGIE